MDLFDAIRGRWATRGYTAAPVERAIVENLIDAAIRAPSAMNEQPWDFCVIEDADRLDDISRRAAAYMVDQRRKEEATALHQGSLDALHFHIFYHAPMLVVISARTGPWMRENAALAAQTMMLAAYDRGLGSCWIGLAQRWLETDEGKAAIACPSGYTPIAPIILGYPAVRSAQAPRQPPQVRWLA